MAEFGRAELERKILEFIQTRPNGTWQEQIMRELNISRPTVSRYVTGLEHSQEIRVEQEGAMKRIYPLPKHPTAAPSSSSARPRERRPTD
jgi:uncharacterized membrane protein